MPTFTHGSTARLFLNGYDVAAYFKTASVAKKVDTVDVTGLNSTSKAYIPGLPDATLTAEGMNDMTAAASGTIADTALGVDYAVTSYYPAGTATGGYGYGILGDVNTVQYDSPVDDYNKLTLEQQATNGAERILATASQAAATAAGTSASVNNTAATTAGWSAYGHVQGNATAATLIVQDSADNSSFAAVGTILAGAITGGSAARFEATGTLRQYTRVVTGITAGTINWQVGVCRTPYL